MADNNRNDRLLRLLGIGLGMAGLLLLGYLLWGDVPGLASSATTTALPTPTQVLITLWDAYEQARTAAQARAEDVQLVSASTQWQAASEQTLLAGASNWSFLFYSAASDNVLDIVVAAEKAQVVDQTQVWVAPKIMAKGAWQAGPRDALLVFLAYGGRAFLDEHPQAVLDLHLAESDSGIPVWTIVALDVGDRSMLSLLVDAGTGQVLSVAP
ncbi:MAG: hypothetical protein SWK90_04255 [Chloroflexota bacterium]|nr:hypothetical protein [Chloroflexota bacterium]